MRAPPIAIVLVLAGCLCAAAQSPSATNQSAAAAQQPAATKTWFVRLIPPRATFDKDMTAEETRVMQQHLAYWKDQFEKGVCLFGGPVLDRRGVYGVLAIAAATEEEARSIASADPSVKAGINKVEVAEMRIAFLHGAASGQ